MKTAVIGVSGFGSVHYKDLLEYRERGELEIAAATVINQDEEAEKCATLKEMGCVIFADYREMLDSFAGEIDLCFIPTGIGMHAPMAIAAMKSGANCMIEKPAAPTIQDVEAMRDAERRMKRFVAVGFQAIYLPEILKLKQNILDGKIGRLKQVRVLGLWPRNSEYYTRNAWAGKIRDSRGNWILDSPFNNALAHYLNLACFLAGTSPAESAKLKSVQATLFRCNPEIENADSASIRLTCNDGARILFHVTHASESTYGPIIRIIGNDGIVETDMKSIKSEFKDGAVETIKIDNSKLRTNLMDSVLKRVAAPSTFICGLDIAGTHTLAVNGAHKSSPVIPTDPNDVERMELENGAHRFVCRNLDAAMKKLLNDGGMPDESQYPWLTPGKEFDLAKFREFNL